jgi:hypothetical protein
MATISIDSLAGYILEELIAYLIRNTGYRLLVDETQDPRELKNLYNGLNVRGRGALHQVDVLGELLWVPAFTFPLRLMIEAKCRRKKTGTEVVRNMMATLIDVNQKHFPTLESDALDAPVPKYTYVGAIFSASGFSDPASKLALAHGISLIDLNTTELSDLVKASRRAAKEILQPTGVQPFTSSNVEVIRGVRRRLRTRLATEPLESAPLTSEEVLPDDPLTPAVSIALETAELFVGMAAGPYILVLKADDPTSFLQYTQERPAHDVSIHWSRRDNSGRTWFIRPVHRPAAYRLWFKLPEQLVMWIFKSESARKNALVAKELFFSTISIYRHSEGRDSLIRLRYAPQGILERAPASE